MFFLEARVRECLYSGLALQLASGFCKPVVSGSLLLLQLGVFVTIRVQQRTSET